jgi:hypothetical protein
MTRHDFRKSGFRIVRRVFPQQSQVITHDLTGIWPSNGKGNKKRGLTDQAVEVPGESTEAAESPISVKIL